jgi:hypothetical protein
MHDIEMSAAARIFMRRPSSPYEILPHLHRRIWQIKSIGLAWGFILDLALGRGAGRTAYGVQVAIWCQTSMTPVLSTACM